MRIPHEVDLEQNTEELNEEQTYSNNEDGDSGSDNETDEVGGIRDVQEAINKQHPFGIKIWKPALYRKGRSITHRTDEALHSEPGQFTSR